MKAGIHPTVKEATVTCACGETFKTKSIKEDIKVEVCSKCHPFFTGKMGQSKKTGAVEKFNRKYGLNEDKKTA